MKSSVAVVQRSMTAPVPDGSGGVRKRPQKCHNTTFRMSNRICRLRGAPVPGPEAVVPAVPGPLQTPPKSTRISAVIDSCLLIERAEDQCL